MQAHLKCVMLQHLRQETVHLYRDFDFWVYNYRDNIVETGFGRSVTGIMFPINGALFPKGVVSLKTPSLYRYQIVHGLFHNNGYKWFVEYAAYIV
jgi:hypothetical protein